MFSALWRVLPVHPAVKIAVIVVVAATVITALFLVTFPWIDGILSDPTIG